MTGVMGNVQAVEARISALRAQFAHQPVRARVAEPAFERVLAAKQVAGSSWATATTSPSSDADWVRGLPDQGKRWIASITAAAQREGIDPRLLTALVQQESGFDPHAVSPVGAIGLGQLMPGTAAALGVDPRDPAQNLAGAAAYLREQLDRFGRIDHALAAYNAGPGRVERAAGVPAIAETVAYVARVLDNYDRLVGASAAKESS